MDGNTRRQKKLIENYYIFDNPTTILRGDEKGGVVVYKGQIDSLLITKNHLYIYDSDLKSYIVINVIIGSLDTSTYSFLKNQKMKSVDYLWH